MFRLHPDSGKRLTAGKCPRCDVALFWEGFSDTVGYTAECKCGLVLLAAPEGSELFKDRGVDISQDEYDQLEESVL